jgi:hypothetical protein
MQRDFHRRKNFVFLGNMTHKPNADALSYLIEKVWPLIRARIPEAELHIYGTNM